MDAGRSKPCGASQCKIHEWQSYRSLGRQWRSPRCAFVSRIAEWAEPVATEDHAASSRYHRAGSSQRGRAGGGRPHRFALGRYPGSRSFGGRSGGTFTFGSSTHPNSAPPHCVEVAGFKIGLYPVTNRAYAGFIEETGRLWQSQDRSNAERQSAPATDLTWRDARAYCDWLTGKWRSHGRIGTDEIVRLPTEPEWERAARGDQMEEGAAVVYPWGHLWADDVANSEETGFNDTCTVGLFPKGRSPYGCYDMAGQVWEWCTTLWGDDMATPSFRYPYWLNDGREDRDAAPSIRRVLRGGCFSSGKLKACCTYRGSLEPDGFWRGNGFRIVVSNKSH